MKCAPCSKQNAFGYGASVVPCPCSIGDAGSLGEAAQKAVFEGCTNRTTLGAYITAARVEAQVKGAIAGALAGAALCAIFFMTRKY